MMGKLKKVVALYHAMSRASRREAAGHWAAVRAAIWDMPADQQAEALQRWQLADASFPRSAAPNTKAELKLALHAPQFTRAEWRSMEQFRRVAIQAKPWGDIAQTTRRLMDAKIFQPGGVMKPPTATATED